MKKSHRLGWILFILCGYGFLMLVSGETWSIPTLTSTWIAYIYLVIFMTVIAFLLYRFVLGKWSASGTSYGFVLIPLVTIVVASSRVGENHLELSGWGGVGAGRGTGQRLAASSQEAYLGRGVQGLLREGLAALCLKCSASEMRWRLLDENKRL